MVFVRRSSLGRHVAAAVVGSLGLALLGAWYVQFGRGPWTAPVVAPVGFGGLLVVAAGWLLRSDLGGRDALRVPVATVLGTAVFGVVALVVALALLPTAPARSALVVSNAASGGGAVGVVVGLFTARRASTVDALREREAALRRSRDEYRDLFDGVGDPVVVHDVRGRVLAGNEAALDRLGYDADRLTALRIGDVETAALGDGDGPAGADRRVAGGRFVYEAAHVTADGATVPVEISASLVRYDGAPAVLTVARDVSDRRASASELAYARDQLRALNRVLRHDIRNDMQIVLGLAHVLEEHVDEAGRGHLDTVRTTGEHVVELTRSSRALARAVDGEVELTLEPVSLDETLRDELDRRREAFDGATLALNGDLPRVTVRANDLLSSVFRNLLNNAVQHSDRPDPFVTVSADVDDGRAVVRVADDGPGIPDGDREAVFGKGEKGIDSEGTGLGLYLVRSLVDHYGGEVWIADNEPRGTSVAVALPVVDAE